MNIGGLGSVGNLAGLVGSVVGLGIVAIVLLTFAPEIAGDINQIGMQAIDAGKMSNGERVNWVLTQGTYTTANEAWATPGIVKTPITNAAGVCMAGALAVSTAVYTPKGTLATIDGTKVGVLTGCKWSSASRSLTALGGGSLVVLLFGAMAILLPAGSLGFLGYFGGATGTAEYRRRNPGRGHRRDRRGGNHRVDSAGDFRAVGQLLCGFGRQPLLDLLPGHRPAGRRPGQLPGDCPHWRPHHPRRHALEGAGTVHKKAPAR